MAEIQTDISSGATQYGLGSSVSRGSGLLAGIGNALNGIFGSDFGISQFSDLRENQIDRSFNAEQAQLDRNFQSSEAQKQRDFEKEMSDTSYQRAVSDMQKAGINPVLAFQQGGASTPSGASASGSRAFVSGSRSLAASHKDNRDKLFSLAKVVAGLYTGNPQMVVSGIENTTVDTLEHYDSKRNYTGHSVRTRIDSREYKYR